MKRACTTPPFNMSVCSMTNCGKTYYLLEMLEREYNGQFDYIFLICPTWPFNHTYQTWKYRHDPDFLPIHCDQDHVDDWLKEIVGIAAGTNSLIILDDVASSQDVKNRTSELVKLAFSVRQNGLSTIVLTQQLTSISRPYRANISKLVTFYNPNRSDMRAIFDDFLGDVDQAEQKEIQRTLKDVKHSRLEIELRHPFGYRIVSPELTDSGC